MCGVGLKVGDFFFGVEGGVGGLWLEGRGLAFRIQGRGLGPKA